MARNIVPTQDLGESLGTLAKRWNELYVGTVTTTNLSDGVDSISINDLINGVGFKTWHITATSTPTAPTTSNNYVRRAGAGFSDVNPFLVPITGKIKVIAAARNSSSPNSPWSIEVRQMPSETVIATLSMGAPEDTKIDDTYNVQVNAGDQLGIFLSGIADLPNITVLIFED